MSPALAGRFLTTGPPGKSSLIVLLITLVWDGVAAWKYLQVIKVSGGAENCGCNVFTHHIGSHHDVFALEFPPPGMTSSFLSDC